MTDYAIATERRQPAPPARTSGQDCRDELDLFFARHRRRTARFEGQVAPEFQAALRAAHAGLALADCDFHHTIETPGGSVYPGEWDLRGHESSYLGQIALEGRSVFEFGPASGWLSAAIADSARLTVVDLPWGEAPELVPFAGVEMAEQKRAAALSARRLRNSWWFTRERLGFEATAVYADIYELPPDLGRTSISLFGLILRHLSNPFRALQQAAALTDEAIVVTDVRHPAGVPCFSPSPSPLGHTHWWGLDPEAISRMLDRLGFGEVVHTQHAPPRMSPAPQLFTVVGRRPRGGAAVRSPASASSVLPLPPGSLRHLVAGTEDETAFLDLGSRAFEALTASLRANQVEPAALERVLDFGCGVGRVTRHWAKLPSVQVDGSDLSSEMIAWARANLPFATFNRNSLEPALAYPDSTFDLIYALSVFTHLPEEMQRPWLRELMRIVRPGGLIYLTTHGTYYLHLLSSEQQRAFAAGDLVVNGVNPGSNACASFHPAAWMVSLVRDVGLEVLEHRERGARGNPEQDSWLLRRP